MNAGSLGPVSSIVLIALATGWVLLARNTDLATLQASSDINT